jgi:hypothetical protein
MVFLNIFIKYSFSETLLNVKESDMGNSKIIINISDLPEYARAELLDFYEFLRAKHKTCSKMDYDQKSFPLSRFVSYPIKVDKIKRFSRDELHER